MFKERILYKGITKHLTEKEYTIITGARQTGKTTILRKIFEDLTEQKKEVYYISFENPLILKDINEHPDNLFNYSDKPENLLLTKRKQGDKRIFILIDEIQYASNPSNLLKYLHDTYGANLKIVATGSSAFYIDRKFKDSLAGRKRIFNLNTLNFEEYLRFKDAEPLIKELYSIRSKEKYVSSFFHDMLFYFNEYLVYGGYPSVVLANDATEKKFKLQELAGSFIKKDIYESNIENEDKFYHLLILLSSQIGNLINRNELAKTLSLSIQTIEHYLTVMHKCFLIDLIKPFYSNVRKEIIKMPKVYFNDIGLRNAILNRFTVFNEREDKGTLLENYFYLRLKDIYDKDQVRFWRTANGNEIDFVVTETHKQGIAFEVKFDGNNFNPSKYKVFQHSYPSFTIKGVSFNQNKNCQQSLKV